jgi:hypothetical protein
MMVRGYKLYKKLLDRLAYAMHIYAIGFVKVYWG